MEQISAEEDFLTCPVCLETFKEPVSLGCNHSFCSSCLHYNWDENKTKKCPVCHRKSSKDFLNVNFALKQLILSFSKKAPAGESEKFCSSHPEQSPLFSLDECRPLCPVCEFSLHSGHKVVSVDSAVSELKEQLHSQLQPLAQRREQASALQRQYEEINLHAQTQVKQCERQIRAKFERLHRFLQQEEEFVLRALREEQSRQAQTIEPQLQKIREKLSTLKQNILTVEEQLKRQSMDFIREYRHTHETTQTLLSQPGPELGPGLLINQAKVLGNMGFKAWGKMRALVHYSPVLLDPNSAERGLHLSEDLRGVRHGDTEQQQIPLNPERFTNYPTVLSCEGFSSGSHQWDVEVGDHPHWIIGVAKESVDRKREREADPENGLWCLAFYSGKYIDAIVCIIVNLKRSPQKIRVRLDYDKGKLSFSDAEDMSLICSHEERFTEKMFPYFSLGEAGDAKTKEIKICSTEGL
ncbi:zinc-binding protein A33-like [Eucyclogobius newberryi]|uniref:zinc-binding protein A33-like n=1 Tax=Eucyclogobius newberryi TaxID=166745 RepID=UPI003B5BF534